MDDPEMEWLQSKDPASCAVWEWLKSDCQKRGTNHVRELSPEELECVTKRLGIDSPRFSQISQNLQRVGWVSQSTIAGWSKWQGSRTPEEDAARKQIEYYKSKAEQLAESLKKVSQSLPTPPKTSLRGEEMRGEERRSHTQEGVGGIEEFRTKVSVAFKRDVAERWSYEEEQQLCEVFKRQNHDSEWDELVAHKEKRGKFFPQSVSKLLGNWTSALDASRNGNGGSGGKPDWLKDAGTGEHSEARRRSEREELDKSNRKSQ